MAMSPEGLSKGAEVVQLSRNPAKALFWAVIIAIVTWFVAHTIVTVLVFSLAVLMAYLISPTVDWLSRRKLLGTQRKIPWSVATFTVYLVILAILIVSLSILVPLIVQQTSNLAASAPEYAKKMQEQVATLRAWYAKLHISSPTEQSLKKHLKPMLDRIEATFSEIAASVAGGLLKFATVLIVLVVSFFFSMFIVLEQTRIKKYLFEMFPPAWRKDTEELFAKVNQVVGVFIRGQIVMSVIAAFGTYLVLTALNLLGITYPYSLLTAVFTGLLYPIPFIGFWIPRLIPPALAFAQTGNWSTAFWVLVGLVGWGLAADNIILPFVMGKGIGISPLMVLLVVCAGGELFGIWGLILAIPAAAVIRLIFFYLQKHVTI